MVCEVPTRNGLGGSQTARNDPGGQKWFGRLFKGDGPGDGQKWSGRPEMVWMARNGLGGSCVTT